MTLRSLGRVALAALAVRLLVAVLTGGLWRPELHEYDAMARAMLDGRGFAYTHLGVVYYSFAAPLFSWVTAAVYWLTGGSAVPLVLFQIAVGSMLAVVTAIVSFHVFRDRLAALGAGLLVAVHPGLVIYNATKAHPLTLDALFFTAVLWLFFRLRHQPTLGRALALGCVTGVATLSRATTLVFLPVGAIWILALTPAGGRLPMAGKLLAAALCAAALVAPWSIRNTRLHHRFVLLQTTDSELLWRGNNPHATGHSYRSDGGLVLDTLPAEDLAELRRQPDEIAQAAWFRARALAYIREHPATFMRITMLKLWHFWWFAPQTGTLYPRLWLRLYQAFYMVLLVLAALGVAQLWASRRARKDALLAFAFMAVLSAFQSLYYVEGRHRWAVEPMIIAVSGGGLVFLRSRFFDHEPVAA